MPCIRRKQILSYYTIAKSPALVTRGISHSFKMLLLTFKAIHKLAPTYTSEHVSELMYLTLGVDNVYDQMTANSS